MYSGLFYMKTGQDHPSWVKSCWSTVLKSHRFARGSSTTCTRRDSKAFAGPQLLAPQQSVWCVNGVHCFSSCYPSLVLSEGGQSACPYVYTHGSQDCDLKCFKRYHCGKRAGAVNRTLWVAYLFCSRKIMLDSSAWHGWCMISQDAHTKSFLAWEKFFNWIIQ